jgi:hypothetical protein
MSSFVFYLLFADVKQVLEKMIMWFATDRGDKDSSSDAAFESKITPQQVADMHGSNVQDSSYSAVAGALGAELLIVDIAEAAGPPPSRGDCGLRADFQPSRTRAMLSRAATMRSEAELMFLVAKCQWTWPQTFGGMSVREAARVLLSGTFEEVPVGAMVSETGASQSGLIIVLGGCVAGEFVLALSSLLHCGLVFFTRNVDAVRKKSIKVHTVKSLGDNYGGCVHVLHRDTRSSVFRPPLFA